MGNAVRAALKQEQEALANAIRSGQADEVRDFLSRVSDARGSSSREPKVKALQEVDLNQPCLQGLRANQCNALQLAASCGNQSILALLLDWRGNVAELDVNAVDSNGRTALHYAAETVAPPRCTRCIMTLIERRADPFLSSKDNSTALDVARRERCVSCVRALEAHAALWQGWVDHYSWPLWRSRWLVIHRDRWPRGQLSCYQCGNILVHWPGSATQYSCPQCGAANAKLVTLALVFYDSMEEAVGAPSNSSVVAERRVVPVGKDEIEVKLLENAGLENAAKAFWTGKKLRAIQSIVSSQRQYGMSVKFFPGRATGAPVKASEVEYSIRLDTPEARDQVMKIFQDPVRAVNEASMSRMPAIADTAAVPSGVVIDPAHQPGQSSTDVVAGATSSSSAPAAATVGGSGEPAWACAECTYFHEGADAARASCKICGSPKPPSASTGSSKMGPPPPPPSEPYPWPEGPWSCPRCTYRHQTAEEVHLSACCMCELPRPKPAEAEEESGGKTDVTSSDPVGALEASGEQPSAPPAESMDVDDEEESSGPCEPWTCVQCTLRHLDANAAKKVCLACGHPRPQQPSPPANTEAAASTQAPQEPPEVAAPAAAGGEGFHLDWGQADEEVAEEADELMSAPAVEQVEQPNAEPDSQQEAAEGAARIATEEVPSGSTESKPPDEDAAATKAPAASSATAEAEEDEGLCVLCWEKPASCAVVPCGHMCGCEGCLEDVKASKNPECPICRGPIQSTIRIYRP
mmetsp:Transcript_66660/g.159340  ORF Transcript_66660/g.159340 Transcript_66660/m.159340 type:complete len:749 (+) Transcript_66660:111-2357(+)